MGFAIEPSFSALSSLGVSQLLTSNVEILERKYLRALNLKHRTFPDLFELFVKNLANIQDKLEGWYRDGRSGICVTQYNHIVRPFSVQRAIKVQYLKI